MVNVMIAGVGGQGTVLASKVVAAAAIEEGLQVRTTETIGMAQRGGSVVSHVRMGREVFSPLVPLRSADLIIAFEPAEGARLLPYLSRQGKMVLCNGDVQPVTSTLTGESYPVEDIVQYLQDKDALIVDQQELLRECHVKTLNIALVGASFCTGVFPFTMEDVQTIIREKLPQKFVEPNLQALEVGYIFGQKGGKV